MSYPTWPGTLPQNPLVNGYSDHRADNVIETKMEIGPAKRRLRGTVAPRMVSMVFHMTQAQVSAFNTFFDVTTSFGVTSFYFPLPPSYAATLVHFKANNVPSWVSAGVEADYTVVVEVDP